MTSTDVERDHPVLVASAQNLLGDLVGFERRLTTPGMEYAHHYKYARRAEELQRQLEAALVLCELNCTRRLSPSFGPLWSRSCSTV